MSSNQKYGRGGKLPRSCQRRLQFEKLENRIQLSVTYTWVGRRTASGRIHRTGPWQARTRRRSIPARARGTRRLSRRAPARNLGLSSTPAPPMLYLALQSAGDKPS